MIIHGQAIARTSTEAELLLCCARTHPDAHCQERFNLLIAQQIDWEHLLQLGLFHGVLPLLYSSLRKLGSEAVPTRILDELRRFFRGNAQSNLFLTAELLKLLSAFEAHGIPAAPFKGPLLALSAYQDLALRQFGDLDLLVHRRDIFEAGKLIVSQGYRPDLDDNEAVDDPKPDPDEIAFLGPQYYTFNRVDGRGRVDLQWRITQEYFSFSLDDERLWDRLAAVSIGGKTVRTFAPGDLLLILCVHGSKHRWEKLKWVCDIAELVRAHKRAIDWEEIQQRGRKQRIQRMLRLGLLLAQDLLGAELPRKIANELDGDSRTKWLAREIRTHPFVPADGRRGKFKRAVFYLRAKDGWREAAYFCLRYLSQYCRIILSPTRVEREVLPLPEALSFIYFFFRPLRLTAKHCWLAAIRVYRRTLGEAGRTEGLLNHVLNSSLSNRSSRVHSKDG